MLLGDVALYSAHCRSMLLLLEKEEVAGNYSREGGREGGTSYYCSCRRVEQVAPHGVEENKLQLVPGRMGWGRERT